VSIRQHLNEFAGLPVHTFDPENPCGQGRPGEAAYRISSNDHDEEIPFADMLANYLSAPGAEETTALVVGSWGYDDMIDSGSDEVISLLVEARSRLPHLRSLFLGEIIKWECEISWIHQGNVTSLLTAYPELEMFRVRGVMDLMIAPFRHERLRHLAIES